MSPEIEIMTLLGVGESVVDPEMENGTLFVGGGGGTHFS